MSDRIDSALDALDRAAELDVFELLMGSGSRFTLDGDRRNFLSVQEMSERLGCSDTTSRDVIHRLINRGLAEGVRVVGADGIRRILVTGEATR